MLKRLFTGLFIALTFCVKSQTTIVFLPVNDYFFTHDQLWGFTVINNGKSSYSASIEVQLLRNGSASVLKEIIQNTTIAKGANIVSGLSKGSALMTYGNDEVSLSFKNTGILSPGNYALCVTVTNLALSTSVYSCLEVNQKGFTLPILTFPSNHAVIYENLPVFSWLPAAPATIADLSYKFELWTSSPGAPNIKLTGDVYEAQLRGSQLPYSNAYPSLSNNVNYSWQVKAYSGDYYLGASQIWDFSIQDLSNAREFEVAEDTDSYRIIGMENDGADYIAYGVLKLGFKNIANDSLLSYQISLANNPDVMIDSLPDVPLSQGMNNLIIDLNETGLFEEDQKYELKITDSNMRNYYLSFIYINP